MHKLPEFVTTQFFESFVNGAFGPDHGSCIVGVQVAANIALVKNLTLHGVFWGSYMQHKPAVLQQSLQELVGLLADDKIKIPVSHR